MFCLETVNCPVGPNYSSYFVSPHLNWSHLMDALQLADVQTVKEKTFRHSFTVQSCLKISSKTCFQFLDHRYAHDCCNSNAKRIPSSTAPTLAVLDGEVFYTMTRKDSARNKVFLFKSLYGRIVECSEFKINSTKVLHAVRNIFVSSENQIFRGCPSH